MDRLPADRSLPEYVKESSRRKQSVFLVRRVFSEFSEYMKLFSEYLKDHDSRGPSETRMRY